MKNRDERMITVGQLRERLKNVDDDCLVVVDDGNCMFPVLMTEFKRITDSDIPENDLEFADASVEKNEKGEFIEDGEFAFTLSTPF